MTSILGFPFFCGIHSEYAEKYNMEPSIALFTPAQDAFRDIPSVWEHAGVGWPGKGFDVEKIKHSVFEFDNDFQRSFGATRLIGIWYDQDYFHSFVHDVPIKVKPCFFNACYVPSGITFGLMNNTSEIFPIGLELMGSLSKFLLARQELWKAVYENEPSQFKSYDNLDEMLNDLKG